MMAACVDAEPGSKAHWTLPSSVGQAKQPSPLQLKTGSDISLGALGGK